MGYAVLTREPKLNCLCSLQTKFNRIH